jgi:hypothetical protein
MSLLDDCDVVAAQEAHEDLVSRLRDRGVHVVWRQRPNHPDGVALASPRHPLRRAGAGDTTDGRRVLVTANVLDVLVVATHLDWADPRPRQQHPGVVQLREVLATVDTLTHASADRTTPVVVGADLNAGWASPVSAPLAAAGFAPAAVGLPTAAIGGRLVELDTLAGRGVRLTGGPQGLDPDQVQDVWLPSGDEPSDHVPLVADVTQLA